MPRQEYTAHAHDSTGNEKGRAIMICTACGGTRFDTEGVCVQCGTPAGAATVATLASTAPSDAQEDAAEPVEAVSAAEPRAVPDSLPSTAPRNAQPGVQAEVPASDAPADASALVTPPVALPVAMVAHTMPADASVESTQPPQHENLLNRVAPEPTPAPRRSSVSVPVASPEDPSSTNPSRGTYCGRCGSAVDPAADFCGICGNPMNEAAMQRVRAARIPTPSMPSGGNSAVMAAPMHPIHASPAHPAIPWRIMIAVAALVLIGLVLSLLLAHHS